VSPTTAPRHLVFEPTAEIFASDSAGSFFHELRVDRSSLLDTSAFDEIRFVVSIWHPGRQRTIDFDSAYVELVCRWDPVEDRWIKLAELEPVIPPYNAGETFDGWIVLPVLAARTAYAISGSGFSARSQLQIRASAYLVA
jgi:hypothetical protein